MLGVNQTTQVSIGIASCAYETGCLTVMNGCRRLITWASAQMYALSDPVSNKKLGGNRKVGLAEFELRCIRDDTPPSLCGLLIDFFSFLARHIMRDACSYFLSTQVLLHFLTFSSLTLSHHSLLCTHFTLHFKRSKFTDPTQTQSTPEPI